MKKLLGTVLTLNSALWILFIAGALLLTKPASIIIERHIDKRIERYEEQYKHRYDSLIHRIDSLENLLNRTQPAKFKAMVNLNRVSTYNPTVAQTDLDSTKTASGRIIAPDRASSHRWIAVSQDLMFYNGGMLHFGDLVYLSGVNEQTGYYTVTDVMASQWSLSADILETVGTSIYLYSNAKLFKI